MDTQQFSCLELIFFLMPTILQREIDERRTDFNNLHSQARMQDSPEVVFRTYMFVSIINIKKKFINTQIYKKTIEHIYNILQL